MTICDLLWCFELKWSPETHVFDCVAIVSGTVRRRGLVGVGVALLEEVWLFWRR